jgi:RNA recognition motif-containing protein
MKNLNKGSTQEQIEKYFCDQNLKVKSIKISVDGLGNSNGEGVIEFEQAADADYAMNVLNKMPYDEEKTVMMLEYCNH